MKGISLFCFLLSITPISSFLCFEAPLHIPLVKMYKALAFVALFALFAVASANPGIGLGGVSHVQRFQTHVPIGIGHIGIGKGIGLGGIGLGGIGHLGYGGIGLGGIGHLGYGGLGLGYGLGGGIIG